MKKTITITIDTDSDNVQISPQDCNDLRGLQEKNKQLKARIEALTKKITEDAPKVEFAELFKKNNTCCFVSDIVTMLQAHGVRIGSIRLFQWLRDHSYIVQHGCLVTQHMIDKGFGQNIITGTYFDPKMHVWTPSRRAAFNYVALWNIFKAFNLTKNQLNQSLKTAKTINEQINFTEPSSVQTRAETDLDSVRANDLSS
jgi:phage antirepressor YoqD-like protein